MTNDYTVIGYTVQNNAIYSFTFGTGQTKVLIDACIHGDEDLNAVLLYNFVYWMLNNQSLNAQKIRSSLKIIAVPIVNVDKFNVTRKNANGVDLNRNFAYGWGQTGSTDPTRYDYMGTSALSEPESQALHNYFIEVKPKVYINLHYFDSKVYWLSIANQNPHQTVYNKYCSISDSYGIAKWPSQAISDGGHAIADAWYYGKAECSFLIEVGTSTSEPTVSMVSEGGEIFNRFLCFMLAVQEIYGSETPSQSTPSPVEELAKNMSVVLVSLVMLGVCFKLLGGKK